MNNVNYMQVLGVVAVVAVAYGAGYYFGVMQVAPAASNMDHAMSAMNAGLEGKTGDDFDHAFLSEMIVHHEGAIEMAQAALERGAHEELKDLARAIIDAQTKEIAQMNTWLHSWYPQHAR